MFFQVDHLPNMMRKHFAFITQTIYFTPPPEVSMFTESKEKLFVSECRRLGERFLQYLQLDESFKMLINLFPQSVRETYVCGFCPYRDFNKNNQNRSNNVEILDPRTLCAQHPHKKDKSVRRI